MTPRFPRYELWAPRPPWLYKELSADFQLELEPILRGTEKVFVPPSFAPGYYSLLITDTKIPYLANFLARFPMEAMTIWLCQLHPECKIAKHIDSPIADQVRVNWSLTGFKGEHFYFHAQDDTILGEAPMKPGRGFIINQAIAHSVSNHSRNVRVSLVVDFMGSVQDLSSFLA